MKIDKYIAYNRFYYHYPINKNCIVFFEDIENNIYFSYTRRKIGSRTFGIFLYKETNL